MSTYNLTAFAESDLVSGDVGYGDTFTMPSAATISMSIYDNDGSLSGDYSDNASDSHGQTAAITGANGASIGNGGQIYIEQYFYLTDQYGNTYVLIEIEQEGSSDDYFTFYTGGSFSVPPAGAELTVGCSYDVCGDWVSYGDLQSPDVAPVTGSISGRIFNDTNADGLEGEYSFVAGQDYVFEAEHMNMNGFRVSCNDDLVKIKNWNGTGELTQTFNGQSGTYDLRLHAQDESDGASTIQIKINGSVVKTIVLDNNNDGWGSDYGSTSAFDVSDIQINAGDEITIWADADNGEWVRIDKLELFGHDTETSTLEPPMVGVEVKLMDTDGNVVATTHTDADGNYTFGDVDAGDYIVRVVNPDGTEFTLQDVGSDDTIDSDFDMGGNSGVITLGAGEDLTDVDAGLVPEANDPVSPPPSPAVEITLDAKNDAITVQETEAAGDTDGNVLANDSASASDGSEVEFGIASDTGVWVEASNGGRVKINSNGSFDFDARGEFDYLNDGQSADTTVTYQLTADGEVVAQQNVLFVFDVSNSTVKLDGQDAFVGEGVGDVNGDGKVDTVLDAQIAAAKVLIADIQSKGIDPANVNVGIVTFSGVASGYANVDSANLGTFSLADANLIDTLNNIQSGGWTNYEAGLGEAEDWFNGNANASDENVMYFMSDGRPITGHDGSNYIEQDMAQFMDEVARIENGFNASVHAIGVGENASMEILEAIDNSETGAAQVTSVSELTSELVAAHDFVTVADTATLTITVEGISYREARNDLYVVSESETAGDVEGNVLDNDTLDNGQYAGTVATVNGTVTKVNTVAQGSNGGQAVINADGTIDFDAAGDFDGLMDGQSAETTFQYTIQGGEMAQITVRVEGETDYAANKDTLVVSESEEAGDTDGNVLTNDTQDNGAYTGDVLGVNGEADNVGETIDGDNGGTLVINADGSMDFAADGDFEDLNDGENAFTTFTYEIEDGKMAEVVVEVQGETDADPEPPVVPPVAPTSPVTINIAIAMQSNSTMYVQGDTNGFVQDWADWDGNGVANQQMDLAYLMVSDFLPEAFAWDAEKADYDVNLSLINFDADKGNAYRNLNENNWQGQLNAKINTDNSGDYGGAMENASEFFDDVSGDDDINLMFFIGNGIQTNSWQEEREELLEDHNVEIDAYLTDLVLDTDDASYTNMFALDSGQVAWLVYADDEDAAGGFGMAQEQLTIDWYLEG